MMSVLEVATARSHLSRAMSIQAGSSSRSAETARLLHQLSQETIASIRKHLLTAPLIDPELFAILNQSRGRHDYYLGFLVQNGSGITKNPERALALYIQAAELGDPYAMVKLGNLYDGTDKTLPNKSVDYAAALSWYQKAAEQRLAMAETNIGHMLEYGLGVAKDELAAIKWHEKAAAQGFPPASRALAFMYMDGRGVAKDEKKGAQLLLQAAEKGLADAQSDIGNCYYRGKGVCRDYSLALLFFRKAAEQNNARAFFSIGKYWLDGEAAPKNALEALKWFKLAVDNGETKALFEIGVCHEQGGEGLPRNMAEAEMWYHKAAEAGDYEAESKLSQLGKAEPPKQHHSSHRPPVDLQMQSISNRLINVQDLPRELRRKFNELEQLGPYGTLMNAASQSQQPAPSRPVDRATLRALAHIPPPVQSGGYYGYGGYSANDELHYQPPQQQSIRGYGPNVYAVSSPHPQSTEGYTTNDGSSIDTSYSTTVITSTQKQKGSKKEMKEKKTKKH